MSRTALTGAIMIALLVVATRSANAADKAAELSKSSQFMNAKALEQLDVARRGSRSASARPSS